MDTFTDLDEDRADALLGGPSSMPPVGLAGLVEVVEALRMRRAAEPVPPMAPALRAQVAARAGVPLNARRSARRALVLAAAAAAVVAFGVGAAQNRLPAGIQDVVSSTVEHVGVHVHTSDERGQGHEHRSDVADTHAQDGVAPTPGHEGTTPGGATPAVPNGPGEPATPAVPAEGNGSNGADHVPTGRDQPTAVQGTVDDPAKSEAEVVVEDEQGTTTTVEAPGTPPQGNGNAGTGSAKKAEAAAK
jgi:hypothetical protein